VYLFATAGLIALILCGPKFASRQSQIERSAQGRQRAIQNLHGEEPVTHISTAENTHIRLRPLYYVLGAILAVAWIQLSWKKIRQRRTNSSVTASASVASKSPR
jgi:hypothetical protein